MNIPSVFKTIIDKTQATNTRTKNLFILLVVSVLHYENPECSTNDLSGYIYIELLRSKLLTLCFTMLRTWERLFFTSEHVPPCVIHWTCAWQLDCLLSGSWGNIFEIRMDKILLWLHPFSSYSIIHPRGFELRSNNVWGFAEVSMYSSLPWYNNIMQWTLIRHFISTKQFSWIYILFFTYFAKNMDCRYLSEYLQWAPQIDI